MNVLREALNEIKYQATSLRESNMTPDGRLLLDPETAAEVEKLERISHLMGLALEALGIA